MEIDMGPGIKVNVDDYLKYRGKCKEFSEALIKEKPELRLVRGFYYCPIMNKEEQHWWCEDKNGKIIDPTRKQFPSNGLGSYREFDGYYDCDNCNGKIHEKDKNLINAGSKIFCCAECYGYFMGVLPE